MANTTFGGVQSTTPPPELRGGTIERRILDAQGAVDDLESAVRELIAVLAELDVEVPPTVRALANDMWASAVDIQGELDHSLSDQAEALGAAFDDAEAEGDDQ